MYNFKAVTLNYKNTPLDIRELISLDKDTCRALSLRLKTYEHISDVLVLSTCNRTEVYYSSEEDYFEDILADIFSLRQIAEKEKYQNYFYNITSHHEAVTHLFRVAMGLESQVVGDMQITNQVKQAYQLTADLDLAGPFLHRLLHTIFFTNKRVVQETPFRSGAASTSYAAVELVEELAAEIEDPRVLVLGIGEIGADVCRNLKDSFIKDIVIVNRTQAKAETLADECGGRVFPFEQVSEIIDQSDVIICSIARSTPFISKALLSQINILSYKFFIDLSVPRSIEPQIEDLPGVLLYNLDQINNKATGALQKRLASIPQVEAIVEESLASFHEWAKEMEISPTIQKLKGALEQIRQDELSRYAKKLSQEEFHKMDKMTKSIMQKIIKLPALQLKAACKRGEAETLIDVLNDLFNLEQQAEMSS